MDIILQVFDTYFFDHLYNTVLPAPKSLKWEQLERSVNGSSTDSFVSILNTHSSLLERDNVFRQTLNLFLITIWFGIFFYFICGSLSYYFVFDKTIFKHPKYLKNQIKMEIRQAVSAFPAMALLTIPFFLAEVRGYSQLYASWDDAPFSMYNLLQIPLFIIFTDFSIYWIHRGLHHPLIYKHLHKLHHKWVMPTPFASHAFHPADGFLQSLPYHIFPFLFPLHKYAYIFLFVTINLWTVFIHDGEYISNSPILNGAACHAMHHLYFNYNYGQFTTVWDRLGGSYRKPNEELFRRETKMDAQEWDKQSKEIESILKTIDGVQDSKKMIEESNEVKKNVALVPSM